MKNTIFAVPFLALIITSCGEKTEAPAAAEEKLGDYSALGTEPGWTVDIKGEEIAFTSEEGKKINLPVDRAKKTGTGWEVRGFSDQDNINISITSGAECSDGMSDRKYADTVKIAAGEVGTREGCGGEITVGGDEAP